MRDDDEIAAAIDVADGHEVGIDHASQLDARGRLADDAQAAQSIMSIQHRGGGDQVDSLFRSTSMKLLLDCVLLLTPDLQLRTRHSRAVTGHAAEEAASAMREREVFLRFASTPSAPPLYPLV